MLRRLLKPQGTMLLQAIVADQRMSSTALGGFHPPLHLPRWFLPSLTAMAHTLAGDRSADFSPGRSRSHYATTLRHWRERFLGSGGVARLGFPDTFIRMWEYYLCYCEAAFDERCIGVVQMQFDHPACRRDALVIVREYRAGPFANRWNSPHRAAT